MSNDDQDDGIPLTNYVAPRRQMPGSLQACSCLSCQHPVFPETRVVLDGRAFDVCQYCWDQLTVAQRIELSQKLLGAPDLREVLHAAASILERIGQAMDRETSTDDRGDQVWGKPN